MPNGKAMAIPQKAWICDRCEARNPSCAEVCRYCYQSSSHKIQTNMLDAPATSPSYIPERRTFQEFVAQFVSPGTISYFLVLGALVLGCVVATAKVTFVDRLSSNSFGVPFLQAMCIWWIRAYLRNDDIYFFYKKWPSTKINSSSENTEGRGFSAFFLLVLYLLIQWLVWR